MTTPPLRLNRDQLASFLKDHRQIRAFENLFSIVEEVEASGLIGTLIERQDDQHTSIETDYIDLPVNAPHVTKERRIQWNDDDGTVDIGLYNGSVLQVGQEIVYYAKNSFNGTIANGTPVMFSGTVGASGKLEFDKAVADGSVPTEYMMGVATQDIAKNEFGYITHFGLVRGFNTTGTPYGEVWNDGDLLYFDPATPGTWTNVQPEAPNLKLPVAVVINAGSGGSGSIFVRMQTEESLNDLQDVQITDLANDDILTYNGDTERWENANQLRLRSGTLGEVTGNTVESLNLTYQSANTDQLKFRIERQSDGADWTTAAHYIYRQVDATPMGFIKFGNQNSDLITFGEATTEYMYLDGSGKLGIGKAPDTTLDILSDNAQITLTDSTTSAVFNLNNNLSGGGVILSVDDTSVGSSPTLQVRVSGTETMRVLPGAVGINNSSPPNVFSVGAIENSTADQLGTVGIKSDANDKALMLQEAVGTEQWEIGVDVDGDLNFYNSGSVTPSVSFQDDGSINFSGSLTVSGEIFANGGIALPDNQKATFGTSDDLQLYHDGSRSYVQDVGTGDLWLAGNEVRIANSDGSRTNLYSVDGGAVSIRYSGNEKIGTTATGVNVTGTLVADGLTVDGVARIQGTATGLIINETDTTDLNSYLSVNSGVFRLYTVNDAFNSFTNRFSVNNSTGDIIFYKADGATTGVLWDVSANNLDITGTVTADGATITGDIVGTTLKAIDGTEYTQILDYGVEINRANGYLRPTTAFDGTANLLVGNAANRWNIITYASDNAVQFTDGTNLRFQVLSGGDVIFYDNLGSEGARWDSSTQSLGINISSPPNMLSVGAIEASGADQLGTVGIKSDANDKALMLQENVGTEQWEIGVDADGDLNFYNSGSTTPSVQFLDAGGIDVTGDVSIGDGSATATRLLMGTGDDSKMFHNGTDTYWINDTGNIIIRNQSDDKDILLQTDDGLGGTTTYITVDGSETDVSLHYGGSVKLATTATGIDVTGDINITGTSYTVNDSNIGITEIGSIYNDGGNGYVRGSIIISRNRDQITYDPNTNLWTHAGGGSTDWSMIYSSFNYGLSFFSGPALASSTSYTNGDFIANYLAFRIDNGSTDVIFYNGAGGEGMRWDKSAGRLGINNSAPANVLSVGGIEASGSDQLGTVGIKSDANDKALMLQENVGTEQWEIGVDADGDLNFYNSGSTTPSVTINDNNNAGIGTTNPQNVLDLGTATNGRGIAWGGGSGTAHYNTIWSEYSTASIIIGAGLKGSDTSATFLNPFTGTYGYAAIELDSFSNDGIKFYTAANSSRTKDAAITPNERVRIDTNGSFLVGTTTLNVYNGTTTGTAITQSGYVFIGKSGDAPLWVNRISNDGSIINLRKDGTTVGSIGTFSQDLYLGTGITGLRFYNTSDTIFPFNPTTVANTDGATSLGAGGQRFKDLYLSGTAYLDSDAVINSYAIGRGSGGSSTNTVFGLEALDNNTSGTQSVAIGKEALRYNTTGYVNTAVGSEALKNNTTGLTNTAVGAYALRQNTTASNNTGVGYLALGNNTTGAGNTAVGRQALASNNGSGNNAFGYRALYLNTTGNNNVAIGNSALYGNTTGNYNIAIGQSALSNNVDTTSNTFIGYATGQLATANYNTAVGYAALQYATGDQNTALGMYSLRFTTSGLNNTATGMYAGYDNTTGNYNVFNGRQAGYNNTTGNYNTLVGHSAGISLTTGSNNTIIGAIAATAGLSDTIIIGAGTTERIRCDSSGNWGIGTTSPSSIFHAVGSGGANSTLRISNTSTLGGNWGVSAGIPTLGNSGFSIYDFDNSSARLHIDSSGNVGIGTTSPATNLEVVGVIRASDGTEYTQIRDYGIEINRANGYLWPTSAFSGSANLNIGGAGTLWNIVSIASDNSFQITDGTDKRFEVQAGADAIFYDNVGVEGMRWDSSAQRLGIGTSSPTEKLDVNGTVKATAFSGSGASLTGVDADLLDGQHGSYYQPASTALTTSTSFGGDVSGTYNAIVVANDSHTHAFNNLTGKTSGTGDYATTGDIVSGKGSGGVALTINDGKGNANVTWNHQNGIPEQNGNAARIEVNTDSTTTATMYFELKSNVSSGIGVDLTPIMRLTETAITAESGISFSGSGASLTNVNAATLDSLDSTQFLRSDTSDTMNGNLTVTNDLTAGESFFGATSYKVRINSTSSTGILEFNSTNGVIRNTGTVLGLAANSTQIVDVRAAAMQPTTDNVTDLGASTKRWDNIYATNGTIQTSDGNEKQDIEALSDAELRVAQSIKGLIRKFRFKSAVAEKGDDARIHFGVIAQDVRAAFEAEGLDATHYGCFCADVDEDGNERLGIRYDELLAFVITAL